MNENNPKPAIEIVARGVCARDGKLLTCLSVRRGTRYLPGGHVEWGETSPQALEREWLEELGVPCKVGPFLGLEEQVYVLDGEQVAEISTIFLVDCPALDPGAPVSSPETHIRFEWIPLDTLPSSRLMPPELARALPEWLRAPGDAAARHLAGETAATAVPR